MYGAMIIDHAHHFVNFFIGWQMSGGPILFYTKSQ
jgi:hypothetical protein